MDARDTGDDGLLDRERLQTVVDTVGWSWREMVDTYLAQTELQMADLAGAVARGDREAIGRVAHSCAGASANCGVVGLVEPCRELERAAETDPIERVAERVPVLSALLERVRPLLNALADSAGS